MKNASQCLMVQSVLDSIRFFDQQGWCPATSSNFSWLDPQTPEQFWMSASGLKKSDMSSADFLNLPIDDTERQVWTENNPARLPSAETDLHACVYQVVPTAQAVYHTHSVNSTVLSRLAESTGFMTVENFEILKGFTGVSSHQGPIHIPVLSNSQDMKHLAGQLRPILLEKQPLWGFMLSGHGLYAWGNSPEQARQHVEVFEFLFDATIRLLPHGHFNHPG
jgi:methylthioribulose-1-phosphate dehydratase